MTAAETEGSGFWEMFSKLETECRSVHMKVPAALINVVWISNSSIFGERN